MEGQLEIVTGVAEVELSTFEVLVRIVALGHGDRLAVAERVHAHLVLFDVVVFFVGEGACEGRR